MNRERKYDITELQWVGLFIGLIGVGITTLPRELVETAGRDGWITLLAATILAIIYLRICLYYTSLFPDMTLAESVQLVLGKWLGRIVVVQFSLYNFIIAGVVIRSFMELIHVYFEVTAPDWAKTFLPLIVIVYIARIVNPF